MPAAWLRSRPAWPLTLAALAIPLLLLAAVAAWTQRSTLDEALHRAERTSASLAEHAQRILETQETLLAAALARVQGMSVAEIAADPSVHRYLQNLERHAPSTSAISIVDVEQGRALVTSASPLPPQTDLSTRDYVEIHRMRRGDSTYIGEVVRGAASGRVGFTVSRRDQSSGLVAVTLVPTDRLISFYSRAVETPRDAVTFAREDGAALAIHPDNVVEPIGYRLPEQAIFLRYQRGELHGTRVLPSGIDGVERIWSRARVGAYPVHVLYGLDLSTVHTGWLRRLAPFALLTALAVAVLLVVGGRAERAIAATLRAEAEADAMRMKAAQADQLERSAAHVRLLMREVNHRAKNLLGVVQAMVRITARRGDPASFAERLDERIKSLAASQDLLVNNSWAGVDLARLVASQLAHFRDTDCGRITASGPPLRVTAAAAQAIGMALHELATNAVKYGALSRDAGAVRITWLLDGATFELRWAETGGPPVDPPTHRGFGHVVIEQMASAATSGKAHIEWRQSGVSWTLTAPAQGIVEAAHEVCGA